MNTEGLRPIIASELEHSNALNCIWDKIPEEFVEELVNLIIQKINWAYARGYENGEEEYGG